MAQEIRINQEDLARKLCISMQTLQKKDPISLEKLGYKKFGFGRGCYYVQLERNEEESIEEAKRRKLIAEANILELKEDRTIQSIKSEHRHEIMGIIIECLGELGRALKNIAKNNDDIEKINNAINDSISNVADSLSDYEIDNTQDATDDESNQ